MNAITATDLQRSFFDAQLPLSVRLRSTAVFHPEGDHWKFIDNIYIVYMNFTDLPAQVFPLVLYAKFVLISFLERNAPTYAVNMYRVFSHLADVIATTATDEVSEITEAHILSYVAADRHSQGEEGTLSAFIARWAELGLPGLSAEAAEVLKRMRKKGNVKGKAVRTLDPIEGPFTDLEVQLLTQALDVAYADGALAPKFYFLTYLAMLTGQRASQYCALKVCDVIVKMDDSGAVAYEISIPKAKLRGASIRDEFLVRPLLRQFGEGLAAYVAEVRAHYPHLGQNAPMFPTDVKSEVKQLDSDFAEHWTPAALAQAFKSALSGIAPLSPRTSAPMHMVIGRFRDTLGTRAAQEGFGELVIAEILGHVDTQNVKCYVAVVPEIAKRLDRALSKDLAPIANAFIGKIIANPSDATRFGDASSDIIDYRNSGEQVGACGTTYNCKFNAPVACYTCPKFEAWLDAPHAALYEQLEREREVALEISGERMAAVNDLTMLAIKNVIDECARMKAVNKKDIHE